MSESHDAYLELCAGAALDALDSADRARFEAHLAEGCPECEAALADYRDAMVAMAATSPAAMPRAAVKEKLLARVHDEPQEREFHVLPEVPQSPRSTRHAPWGLVWGLAAFGLLFLALNFLTWQRGNTLLEERDAARAEVARLSRELDASTNLVAVLQSPEAKLALLFPTPEANQNQRGTGYFDPRTGNAFIVFRNMDRQDARDFELWALHGPTPTSLGLLRVEPSGTAVVNLKAVTDPAHLSAFAVSLEPVGGSKGTGPSGPVVLVGSFGS